VLDAFFEQRIENYKELLRAHYREGERLTRELKALLRLDVRWRRQAEYLASPVNAPTAMAGLSGEMVAEIRAKAALGIPATILAKQYGRHRVTIGKIIKAGPRPAPVALSVVRADRAPAAWADSSHTPVRSGAPGGVGTQLRDETV